MDYTYDRFIQDLNSGRLKKMEFCVPDYGHYKSCVVTCQDAITKTGKLISFSLTKDQSECFDFYGSFNESEKLFQIKGKGSFTLKEMWKSIEVKSVEFY